MALYTYLTMTIGPKAGMSYLLEPGRETRIGRGDECSIALGDPLCSRVHAVVSATGNAWRIRDAESRNGTFVNDQKIDEAVLADGHTVRVGSTEFDFHQSEQPPTAGSIVPGNMTQTIIRDTVVGDFPSSSLRRRRHSRLGASPRFAAPLSVQHQALGLHRGDGSHPHLAGTGARTDRRLGGRLFVGQRRRAISSPSWSFPSTRSRKSRSSQSLTDLVCQQGHAVWVANQRSIGKEDSLQHYADALCVPLVAGGVVLGAIHVYLERGRFRQSDFDFAIRWPISRPWPWSGRGTKPA